MTGMYIDRVRFERPFDEETYLTRIPAVRWLTENGALELRRPVTFFVGENGTGKSTLIEAIAIASGFNPEGGSANFNFHTEDSYSDLWEHIRLERSRRQKDGFFLRAESFYNVASNIDQLDREPGGRRIIESFGGVSLLNQSHGESFLAMVHNRLSGHGLYIFDEPEAALSPSRLMTLLVEMDRLVKEDSQFIISTHSPILMAYPGAEIYELSESGIRSVDYRQTDNYVITKRFLDDPASMLRYLLEEP